MYEKLLQNAKAKFFNKRTIQSKRGFNLRLQSLPFKNKEPMSIRTFSLVPEAKSNYNFAYLIAALAASLLGISYYSRRSQVQELSGEAKELEFKITLTVNEIFSHLFNDFLRNKKTDLENPIYSIDELIKKDKNNLFFHLLKSCSLFINGISLTKEEYEQFNRLPMREGYFLFFDLILKNVQSGNLAKNARMAFDYLDPFCTSKNHLLIDLFRAIIFLQLNEREEFYALTAQICHSNDNNQALFILFPFIYSVVAPISNYKNLDLRSELTSIADSSLPNFIKSVFCYILTYYFSNKQDTSVLLKKSLEFSKKAYKDVFFDNVLKDLGQMLDEPYLTYEYGVALNEESKRKSLMYEKLMTCFLEFIILATSQEELKINNEKMLSKLRSNFSLLNPEERFFILVLDLAKLYFVNKRSPEEAQAYCNILIRKFSFFPVITQELAQTLFAGVETLQADLQLFSGINFKISQDQLPSLLSVGYLLKMVVALSHDEKDALTYLNQSIEYLPKNAEYSRQFLYFIRSIYLAIEITKQTDSQFKLELEKNFIADLDYSMQVLSEDSIARIFSYAVKLCYKNSQDANSGEKFLDQLLKESQNIDLVLAINFLKYFHYLHYKNEDKLKNTFHANLHLLKFKYPTLVPLFHFINVMFLEDLNKDHALKYAKENVDMQVFYPAYEFSILSQIDDANIDEKVKEETLWLQAQFPEKDNQIDEEKAEEMQEAIFLFGNAFLLYFISKHSKSEQEEKNLSAYFLFLMACYLPTKKHSLLTKNILSHIITMDFYFNSLCLQFKLPFLDRLVKQESYAALLNISNKLLESEPAYGSIDYDYLFYYLLVAKLGLGEKETLNDIDTLLRCSNLTYDLHYLKACIYLDNNNYIEAFSIINEKLLNQKDDPRGYSLWAAATLQQLQDTNLTKEQELAIQSKLDEARKLKKEDPYLHLAEGILLYRQNRLQEALKAFEKAKKRFGLSSAATYHNNLYIYLCLQEGRFQDALVFIQELKSLSPKDYSNFQILEKTLIDIDELKLTRTLPSDISAAMQFEKTDELYNLLEKNPDFINYVEIKGETILTWAVKHRDQLKNGDEFIKKLLRLGASPYWTNDQGETPLMIAIQKEFYALAGKFIESPALLTEKDLKETLDKSPFVNLDEDRPIEEYLKICAHFDGIIQVPFKDVLKYTFSIEKASDFAAVQVDQQSAIAPERNEGLLAAILGNRNEGWHLLAYLPSAITTNLMNYFSADFRAEEKEKIKQEILHCSHTLALHREFFQIMKIRDVDMKKKLLAGHVNKIVSLVQSLPDKGSLTYALDWVAGSHVLYLNFSRQQNELIVRIDNLGEGVSKHPRLFDPEIKYRPCVIRSLPYEALDTEQQISDYLQNVVQALMLNSKMAMGKIYDCDECINFPEYPAKEKQRKENCVVAGYIVGREIRLGKSLDKKLQRTELALANDLYQYRGRFFPPAKERHAETGLNVLKKHIDDSLGQPLQKMSSIPFLPRQGVQTEADENNINGLRC
jgi:ankyrin repeat protein